MTDEKTEKLELFDRNLLIERCTIEMRKRYYDKRMEGRPVNVDTMTEVAVAGALAVADELEYALSKMLERASTELLERAMVALAERARRRELGEPEEPVREPRARARDGRVRVRAARRVGAERVETDDLRWSPPPNTHGSRYLAMATYLSGIGGRVVAQTHDEVEIEFPTALTDAVERRLAELMIFNPGTLDVPSMRREAVKPLAKPLIAADAIDVPAVPYDATYAPPAVDSGPHLGGIARCTCEGMFGSRLMCPVHGQDPPT